MSVPLVGPDGRKYVFDGTPDELAAAQAKGFHVAEEQTTLDSLKELGSDISDTASALGGGLAQGLTANLYGAGLGAEQGDEETPAAAQARWAAGESLKRAQEESPIASGVGELAGMVVSPINKLAPAIEGQRAATVLGRLGLKTLSGAAIGSLYGAGNAVSDAALGDTQLSAEKLIASAGLGALLGGVGGGFGGAIEEGAAKVLPKLSTLAPRAQSALEDFADDRWLKATGGIQNEIKKIPASEHGAVADVIRQHLTEPGSVLPKALEDALASLEGERQAVAKNVISEAGITDAGGLAPHLSRDEAREALDLASETHGKRMGAVMDAADKMGAQPSYSQVLARLDNFEAGLNPAERDLASRPLADLRRYLDEMGSKPVGSRQNSFAALNDLKSTITKGINYKVEDNVAIGLKKQLAGILRDEIDTQLAPQIGADLSKEWLAAKSEFGALSRADDALGRKSATGLDAIRALASEASATPPSMPRLNALEHARNLLQRGIDRKLGNRWLSASDYLTGIAAGVAHGNPLGALTGLATSIGHKFLRENGAAVIARIADKLASSPTLAAVAHSFASRLPQTAPQLGAYGQSLLRAAARSPFVALAQHIVMAQTDPTYSATAQMAGLKPETPDEHVASLGKATNVAAIHAALEAHDEELKKGVDRVVKGTASPRPQSALKSQDFGARRMRREDASGYDKRVSEVRELAANPQALVDRISQNLGFVGDSAPAVTAAMTDTADRAVKYLAQQAEVPPNAGPLAHEWETPEADRQSFSEKLEVVQNPMVVLHNAAAGTLTEQQVDALRAVYPRLAQHISDTAMERLLEGGERVPYRARIMVSLLTGIDVDGTLSPDAIARNQAAISASAKKQEASGSPGTPKAADSISLAQRTATPHQRRESAEE